MARYIDADALEYEILHADFEVVKHECKDYESYVNGANCFRSKAKNLINKAPTCDVLPRSDYENAIKIAEYQQNLSIKRYYDIKRLNEQIEMLNDQIEQAKQEVAREIFEEIEKNLVSIDDVDFNRFRCIGARTFAELKKKYIGEVTENEI